MRTCSRISLTDLDEFTKKLPTALDISLARHVTEALMPKDAIATYAQDELGPSARVVARSVQAG
jgi:hypothetical protein